MEYKKFRLAELCRGKFCPGPGLGRKLFLLSLVTFFIIFPAEKIQKDCFPAFRVVIDPGHGGVCFTDKQKHGDKYDPVTGEYKIYFAEGAAYGRLYEHEIVYNVARKTVKLLSMCGKDGDFKRFSRILKKYTGRKPDRVIIETLISRGPSVDRKEAEKMDDPNAAYRLYDFPGKDGKMQNGRISQINSFKPHLVVSIHLARSAPPEYKGMNAVIAPPYNVLRKGLDKLRTGKRRNLKDHGVLDSWFQDRRGMSQRRAFYRDVSYYFTGFDLDRRYRPDYKKFKGYRYNMVNWSYRDDPGWEKKAAGHKKKSRYADYRTFKEKGRYWEREKSVYEKYRRGDSFRNFGGDNYYASYEIIKYILLSLQKKGIHRKDKIPGKPFVSVWSVPLLVNAISAYIEIGYLDRKWDRKVLVKRQDEIAEGIAVGVYSLLAGLDGLEGKYGHKPSGKKIDLNKYRITKDKSYFDTVTE